MEFYEIADKIKNIRKEKKLSQSALAEKVGVSRQTLSKLESGELGKISLQVFIKVLEVLEQQMHIEEQKPFYYFDPKSVE